MLALCVSMLSCTRASLPTNHWAFFPHKKERAQIAPFQKPKFIIIDPGHGGKDLGSQAACPMSEKDLNLKTAHLVASYLKQMGFKVMMTRQNDRSVSLQNRASLANQAQGDFFISIHHNAAPSKSAEGIEVFYYRSDTNLARMQASQLLAKKVLQRLCSETGAKSRGVKEGNLAVIRETLMPAVLVECGFLTNAHERALILERSYMQKVAKGIALGIKEYAAATP